MKKSHSLLLKLANKFENKYAQAQSLQEIIQNAASYGESSNSGIMNFPAQLKKDQADMNINITITSATLGGLNVEVSPPAVEPPQFAPNYAKLPAQIKKYLDKYISDFPQVPQGTTTLQFTGRTPGAGVAQN